jgi:hypothetical protein
MNGFVEVRKPVTPPDFYAIRATKLVHHVWAFAVLRDPFLTLLDEEKEGVVADS